MKELGEVRSKAVALLSRREYCRQEMVEKLISKGARREHAESVVEQLSSSSLISEERFSKALIRVRVRQGYGPVRIKYELTQRGVADDLATTCLAEWNDSWTQQLSRVIERKYGDRPANSFNEWAKRANFLKNRGFTTDQIHENLEKHRKVSQTE